MGGTNRLDFSALFFLTKWWVFRLKTSRDYFDFYRRVGLGEWREFQITQITEWNFGGKIWSLFFLWSLLYVINVSVSLDETFLERLLIPMNSFLALTWKLKHCDQSKSHPRNLTHKSASRKVAVPNCLPWVMGQCASGRYKKNPVKKLTATISFVRFVQIFTS